MTQTCLNLKENFLQSVIYNLKKCSILKLLEVNYTTLWLNQIPEILKKQEPCMQRPRLVCSDLDAPNHSRMSDKTAGRYIEVSYIVNAHWSHNYGRIRQQVVLYSCQVIRTSSTVFYFSYNLSILTTFIGTIVKSVYG